MWLGAHLERLAVACGNELAYRILSEVRRVDRRSVDLFLATFSAHADGWIGSEGWHRRGLGETRLWVPSGRHGSSAFAVGMLRDVLKKHGTTPGSAFAVGMRRDIESKKNALLHLGCARAPAVGKHRADILGLRAEDARMRLDPPDLRAAGRTDDRDVGRRDRAPLIPLDGFEVGEQRP